MLDATDIAQALTIPCPKTACAAFCGEQCISFVTGKAVEIPHRERVEAARATARNAGGYTGADR